MASFNERQKEERSRFQLDGPAVPIDEKVRAEAKAKRDAADRCREAAEALQDASEHAMALGLKVETKTWYDCPRVEVKVFESHETEY